MWLRQSTLLVLLVANMYQASGSVYSPVDITEDMHETPRFQIKILDELIPDSKLDSVLAGLQALAEDAERRQDKAREPDAPASSDPDTGESMPSVDGEAPSEVIYDPIVMRAGRKWRFLCQIPRVDQNKSTFVSPATTPPTAKNTSTDNDDDEDASDREAQKKEAEQAIERGLELLQPLKSSCITYTTGWWTFEYCHERLVRQYHRMAPDKHGHAAEIEYRLGEYTHRKQRATLDPADTSGQHTDVVRATQIRRLGRKQFLTQVWAGGTVCDITRQPREVEIQFHCDANSPERITMVEETAICQYVVVINTPRLCADPSFYDMAASEVYDIRCQQVVADSEFAALVDERERMLHLEPEGMRVDVGADDDEGNRHMDADDSDDYDDAADAAPLAMLRRKAEAEARGGKGAGTTEPQVVVNLNDPELAKIAHHNKDMVRKLLAMAFGDAKLKVEFAENADNAVPAKSGIEKRSEDNVVERSAEDGAEKPAKARVEKPAGDDDADGPDTLHDEL
ncbi:Protein OS-9 [Coemansia sp. RSA 2618]|nr:Protein OS-9 [Coemansia sp. RSA 2618]